MDFGQKGYNVMCYETTRTIITPTFSADTIFKLQGFCIGYFSSRVKDHQQICVKSGSHPNYVYLDCIFVKLFWTPTYLFTCEKG